MPESARSEYPIEVVWEGEGRYRGGRPGGPTLLVDSGKEAAPSPVEAVLVALGSCSAVDVVEILTKRRTPPEALRVRLEFARAANPPRRVTEVKLFFALVTASERNHVERAVELSLEKYCSVAHSLAPDIQISWEVELQPAGGTEGET
jgi:putative redox protein